MPKAHRPGSAQEWPTSPSAQIQVVQGCGVEATLVLQQTAATQAPSRHTPEHAAPFLIQTPLTHVSGCAPVQRTPPVVQPGGAPPEPLAPPAPPVLVVPPDEAPPEPPDAEVPPVEVVPPAPPAAASPASPPS
jgi:hypothetical protein